MQQSDWEKVIEAAIGPAARYLQSLPDRPVYRPADPEEIRALIGGPLPESGTSPEEVVATLAGTSNRSSPPMPPAATSGSSSAASIRLRTGPNCSPQRGIRTPVCTPSLPESQWRRRSPPVGFWSSSTFPRHAGVGFVTGGQMATFTCLAAARHHVLREAGWDVEADGLQGAPKINVVVKSEWHSTVPRALRFLGLGDSTAVVVPSDGQSRIDPEALDRALAQLVGPTIVSVESANVNTGSFDPFEEVADLADHHRERGNPTWVHVDGAVGLWARASVGHHDLTAGLERLDSWSTDAHKLLNVSYDSGIAISRHPAAHRAAMSVHASYLIQSDGAARDQMDWNPEFSRRARGLAVYATLRSLGRSGVADMVDRTCSLARRFADQLSASGRAEVMNEVVFNQVLVRWLAPDGDHDAFNDRVIAAIQADGTAFFSGTTWGGMRLMRISVSDWATDEDDVDRAVEALLRCAG